MKSRREEIVALVDSFVATIAPHILRYRNWEGENVVKHFAERVEQDRLIVFHPV